MTFEQILEILKKLKFVGMLPVRSKSFPSNYEMALVVSF